MEAECDDTGSHFHGPPRSLFAPFPPYSSCFRPFPPVSTRPVYPRPSFMQMECTEPDNLFPAFGRNLFGPSLWAKSKEGDTTMWQDDFDSREDMCLDTEDCPDPTTSTSDGSVPPQGRKRPASPASPELSSPKKKAALTRRVRGDRAAETKGRVRGDRAAEGEDRDRVRGDREAEAKDRVRTQVGRRAAERMLQF